MHKIFIDGEFGTTGLRVKSLLAPFVEAGQVEIMTIADKERRKDTAVRADHILQADLSILCLPDDEAKSMASLVSSSQVRIIDASSAHRTDAGWTYGFPELGPEQPRLIASSNLVSNPGCYATGAIAIIKPLVDAGVLSPDSSPHIDGISGYSGGGKSLIAKYEAQDSLYAKENSLRIYALHSPHKHISEIRTYSGLIENPVFTLATINAYQGMKVSAAFSQASLGIGLEDIHAIYENAYNHIDSKVHVMSLGNSESMQVINFEKFASFNSETQTAYSNLDLYVTGWEQENSGQIMITSILDNLGKGASSQAIQNMRLMLNI